MNNLDQNSVTSALPSSISDDGIAGLEIMLNRSSAGDQLATAFSSQSLQLMSFNIEHVRYKPATNCIIGYSVKYVLPDSAEEKTIYVYAKCSTSEDFAHAKEKFGRMDSVGPVYPVALGEIRTILYPIWCDKALDGIELAFLPRKMARPLREGLTEFPETEWRLSDKKLRTEIVRYKPERRAIIKLDTRVKHRQSGEKQPLTVYARCYADARGGGVGPLMSYLADEGGRLSQPVIIPTPLSYLPEKKTLLTRSVIGRPLSELLGTSEADGFFHKVGQAIRFVHNTKYDKLGRVSTDDILSELLATANTLRQMVPSQAGLINEIESICLKRLKPEINSPIGLMHGDFYADQILVSSKDNPVAILDFDRATNGPQIVDLANFCANLRLNCIWQGANSCEQSEATLLSSYYDSKDMGKLPGQFEPLIALQMLKQVIIPFRRWAADWPGLIQIGLKAIREVLA